MSETTQPRPLAVVLDDAEWFVKVTEIEFRVYHARALQIIKELVAHLEVDE